MAEKFKELQEKIRVSGGRAYQQWKEWTNVVNFRAGDPSLRQSRPDALKELWHNIEQAQLTIDADTAAQGIQVGNRTTIATNNAAVGEWSQAAAALSIERKSIIREHADIIREHLPGQNINALEWMDIAAVPAPLHDVKQMVDDLKDNHLPQLQPLGIAPEPNTLPDTVVINMQAEILGVRGRLFGAMNMGQAYREDAEDWVKEFFDSIATSIGAMSPGSGRFQTRRSKVMKDVFLDLVALEWLDRVQVDENFTLRQACKAVMHDFYSHSIPDYDQWENFARGSANKRDALYEEYRDHVSEIVTDVYEKAQARRDTLYEKYNENVSAIERAYGGLQVYGSDADVGSIPDGRSWEVVAKLWGAVQHRDPAAHQTWGAINKEIREGPSKFGELNVPGHAAHAEVVLHGRGAEPATASRARVALLSEQTNSPKLLTSGTPPAPAVPKPTVTPMPEVKAEVKAEAKKDISSQAREVYQKATTPPRSEETRAAEAPKPTMPEPAAPESATPPTPSHTEKHKPRERVRPARELLKTSIDERSQDTKDASTHKLDREANKAWQARFKATEVKKRDDDRNR